MNYNRQNKFYCGVDLRARSVYVHIVDHKGKTVFDRDLTADPGEFLDAIKPFRKNIVVGCECMFAWYGNHERRGSRFPSPNDQAQQPGPLAGLHTAHDRNAAPVCCKTG